MNNPETFYFEELAKENGGRKANDAEFAKAIGLHYFLTITEEDNISIGITQSQKKIT